jgi:xanthine dehydrogenase accessory factor
MIVARETVFGSVGGGNLEAVAVKESRVMLENGTRVPEFLDVTLTEKAVAEFGVQCCGGEVKLLLEPMIPERSQIAIFGVGHVGLALTRILSALPLEILLSDSRSDMLESTRFTGFSSVAQIRTFNFPHPSPEFVMTELKSGAMVLILTHDHSEDITILETALTRPQIHWSDRLEREMDTISNAVESQRIYGCRPSSSHHTDWGCWHSRQATRSNCHSRCRATFNDARVR